ncbi:MAG: DEAD/DEAH box helicase family protein [Eubacteriales bacterium]
MTNFDYFTTEEKFNHFSTVAVSAERILHIDPSASAVNCRRAMEFAVKWLYTVDKELQKPLENTLFGLMNTNEFRDIVPSDIVTRMHYIRKAANGTAHEVAGISIEMACLCLENLFYFLDFVACCYGDHYEEHPFHKEYLQEKTEEKHELPKINELDFEKLLLENQALKEQLTEKRKEQKATYVPKPLDISEHETRKLYIDQMLRTAGWVEGKNWVNEVRVEGMPNASGIGFADYVLYGSDKKPLAVIEAKSTCTDVSVGRKQAELYADALEKQYGVRPVIFLTNGFHTTIEDGQYPERVVSTIYSKRDLEKLFNLRNNKESLDEITINQEIAGRYYQEGAIKAVCRNFGEKNRRKALLVMATGSGKTRTVIGLLDVLLKKGWVKNVLFLADRTSLLTQANRSFVNLLPQLSVSNLCETKKKYSANCIFSTYPTMMNCIDQATDQEGKIFTSGHFDLIICDEVHRSIYKKYRDIFTYFDAPLVGLTATPKDDIDKNTYEVFQLENGDPTYGYELAQAVKDGYLVDFMSVETKLKFIEQGIRYSDLSEEEKEEYENTFSDEDGNTPSKIDPVALNEWLFNKNTIEKVLETLMEHGLYVDYGNKIGKTIIFAKNHRHAEEIFAVFNEKYPHLKGYAEVIDNYINYAQKAIDDFSEMDKMPQIAISVDMLDTGIDVPEVLNLVFFKKVMSKAKFWQMIGRGTRLCAGLVDGVDKSKFYIFDFCGNFQFFRMNEGVESGKVTTLKEALFSLKVKLVFQLQKEDYQSEEYQNHRKIIVSELESKIAKLSHDHFAVQQHLSYVVDFSTENRFDFLSFEDTLKLEEHIAPLVEGDEDEISALRFDGLLLGLEVAFLAKTPMSRGKTDLMQKAKSITEVTGATNIPEIQVQRDFLAKILETDFVQEANVSDLEQIRTSLRGLLKFVKKTKLIYATNFHDDILDTTWHQSELENDDLKNYKSKAEFYVREHQDHPTIAKLKHNIPLTEADMSALEEILWSEVGSSEEYKDTYGAKPLGEFVRELVGLDMNAAKEAFSEFLGNTNFDSRQIYFINQIVEYIVHNGMMKDLSVLQESPFTDKGSVAEIFEDLSIWQGIRSVIEGINKSVAA